MKTLKSSIYGTIFALLLSTNLIGDCQFELFSISSTKGTKIIDFVEQLSDECEFSIIVTDTNAKEFLDSPLNKTHIKNLTIDEVFNIILIENNLSYTLNDNILKISYLTTKIFAIDYILSQRKSSGSTNITLSSGSAADSSSTEDASTNANSESGTMIESNDEVKFWEELDLELQGILNRPHDAYKANAPIINKNAGLITVTATVKQMKRLDTYLKRLQKKVQLQVLIDVQLLSVKMHEGKSTGVDWSQLYKLQNMAISANVMNAQNVSTFTGPDITTALYPDATTGQNIAGTSALFKASGTATLNEVVKFLQTQGDVSAISNPKVLTLNNQPALITVGTEYFYKLTSTETLAGTGAGTQSADENVKSVFAGVLLDITPEISEDNTITLKINPSVSETTTDMSAGSADRTMPPDLERRQLSSVVTVKDGNRIILGGLINSKTDKSGNQIPVLGDIPILGNLFKYEENTKSITELIIIIEPHIINKENSKISLKDLGYHGLTDALLNKNEAISKKLTNTDLK